MCERERERGEGEGEYERRGGEGWRRRGGGGGRGGAKLSSWLNTYHFRSYDICNQVKEVFSSFLLLLFSSHKSGGVTIFARFMHM